MALRTLYLIRHGAYDCADPRPPAVGKGLVEKGIRQAQWNGRRRARLGISFDRCHGSALVRARETAAILLAQLPPLGVRHTKALRECLYPPHHARPAAGNDNPSLRRLRKKSMAHVLNAHRRFFLPARGKDKHELLVCHGNLIRCLVNMVLGLKPPSWVGMGANHCGITVVEVHPNGCQILVAHNDLGHLPPHLVGE